ncbi:MAG TPA: arginyltransferase [Alphaproteobacteria bacterium]|nr:arginyltransferase [Alphaproteobacteria bacterium]
MSVIAPVPRTLLQFYRSGPLPCPYLPGRIERKLFTRLSGEMGEMNSTLSRAGFRRSHDILYRPICGECSACVPVRVPAADFRGDRTQRRILRRNADLRVAEEAAVATEEQFALFHAYQAGRHGDSDMARMGFADYKGMVEEGRGDTLLLTVRDAERRLVAAMLVDRLADGYSAIYSFYDTAEPERSLGTFLILALIAGAQTMRLPYVYLGYWVRGSRKMDYKARFRPLEALTPQGWRPLPETPADPG